MQTGPAVDESRIKQGDYASGSGGDILVFSTVGLDASSATRLDLNGGAILASEAATSLRLADLTLL